MNSPVRDSVSSWPSCDCRVWLTASRRRLKRPVGNERSLPTDTDPLRPLSPESSYSSPSAPTGASQPWQKTLQTGWRRGCQMTGVTNTKQLFIQHHLPWVSGEEDAGRFWAARIWSWMRPLTGWKQVVRCSSEWQTWKSIFNFNLLIRHLIVQ